MGANQSGGGSGNPVGTDWKAIQNDRKKFNSGEVDLPEIPLNKLKEVTAEVDMTVKQSKFLVEYKREFREALKRKNKKGHEPKLFRLYDKSLHPADDAAGKEEDRKAMIKMLTENISPVVKDDILDVFKEEGKQGSEKQLSREADGVIFKLIHERVHEAINDVASVIYKKYQQNKDFEASDAEEDDDAIAAKEEARAARAKEAAKQREYERAVWEAEQNGEEPPPKPDAVKAEEEEYEESEEEEDEE